MPFPVSRPALRLLGATIIGLACLGNAGAHPPTIVDEITVAALTPGQPATFAILQHGEASTRELTPLQRPKPRAR